MGRIMNVSRTDFLDDGSVWTSTLHSPGRTNAFDPFRGIEFRRAAECRRIALKPMTMPTASEFLRLHRSQLARFLGQATPVSEATLPMRSPERGEPDGGDDGGAS
jgi:hypothetical protein